MKEAGSLSVYCADIGSGSKFGWAFGRPGEMPSPGGSGIEDLAARVARDLEAGGAVALGFECPLFVPVPAEASRLGASRAGEGNRPWSGIRRRAGIRSGCAICATGRGELRWRGRIEPFRTTEIPDDEKPRILGAYLARWGYQVRPYFRALPNAADHPVFRIERP